MQAANSLHTGGAAQAEIYGRVLTVEVFMLKEAGREKFDRILRQGSSKAVSDRDSRCILIKGDGRRLDVINDASIDCIITDHPWDDPLSNRGGNRGFTDYECFRYSAEDFEEKARVLKDGCFLCEILPAENANNFDYLYEVKKMAQRAGLCYYAKVPWIKGTFVSNTGRKAKNSEDVLILSKGPARALRPNMQYGRDAAGNPVRFMSGTRKMLPTDFNVQDLPNKLKICKSAKPTGLFEQILDYVTMEGEVVLDQFAGSGAVGAACMKMNRYSILIEKGDRQAYYIMGRLQMSDSIA